MNKLVKEDKNILYYKVYDTSGNIRDNIYKVVLTLLDDGIIEVKREYIKEINLLRNTFEFQDVYVEYGGKEESKSTYKSVCVIPLSRIKFAVVLYET